MGPDVRLIVSIIVLALGGSACGRSESPASEGRTVTIYVSTDRVFSEPVLREYERRSGVKVNPVYDTEETKSTGLANRLLAEKARPQADARRQSVLSPPYPFCPRRIWWRSRGSI